MRLESYLQGNDAVQQHIASEREKTALIAISPMARRAISQEVLPQLEGNLTNASRIDELNETTKKDITFAFKAKNEIYTRLTGYKSIDQSDSQYLEDLLLVMDEWAARSKRILGENGAPAPQVAVPAEPVEVEVEVEPEIEFSPPTGDPDGVDAGGNSGMHADVIINGDVFLDQSQIQSKTPTSKGKKLPASLADIFDLGDVRL